MTLPFRNVFWQDARNQHLIELSWRYLLKVGFAGAGAVGCHYGSKLSQTGNDVMLLARGEHLQVLQQQGLRHESEGNQKQVVVAASNDVNALSDCQVIVLSCKMTGLPAILAALTPVVAPGMLLITLQNGVEAADLVAAAFPGSAVMAGTAFIGARLEAPGYVIHSAAGGISLGRWQQGYGEQHIAPLLSALNQAQIAVREESDASAMLWRKLLWNCGFNALTAITRRYAKTMAASDETRIIVRAAMAETVALAQYLGVAINAQDMERHIEVTLAMGPVKTSMWQDLDAGHQTEVNFINGYVAKRSSELGLPTPVNSMLTALIHAIEGP